MLQAQEWYGFVSHWLHDLKTFKEPHCAPTKLSETEGKGKGKVPADQEDSGNSDADVDADNNAKFNPLLDPHYNVAFIWGVWGHLKTAIPNLHHDINSPVETRVANNLYSQMLATTTAFINPRPSSPKQDWLFILVAAVVESTIIQYYHVTLMQEGAGCKIRQQLTGVFNMWGYKMMIESFPWVDGIALEGTSIKNPATRADFVQYTLFNHACQEDQDKLCNLVENIIKIPGLQNSDGELSHAVHKGLGDFLAVS